MDTVKAKIEYGHMSTEIPREVTHEKHVIEWMELSLNNAISDQGGLRCEGPPTLMWNFYTDVDLYTYPMLKLTPLMFERGTDE